MTNATRNDRVEWAKQRALAELDADPHGHGPSNALTSIISDLREHSETQQHQGIELTMLLMISGTLTNADRVREHINGFR